VITPGTHSAFTLGCENVTTGADLPTIKLVVQGVCPSLQGQCHNQDFCTDFQNDPNNCGGCDNVCGSGQSCVYGSCQSPYPSPPPSPSPSPSPSPTPSPGPGSGA
jgi:hypothetical protein